MPKNDTQDPIILQLREQIRQLQHENKILASQLAMREQQLYNISEHSPILFFSVLPDGFIINARGETAHKTLGLEEGDMVGQSIQELAAEQPGLLHCFHEACQGELSQCILELRRGVFFNFSLSPVRDTKGKIIRIDGVAVDISQLRNIEKIVFARQHHLVDLMRLVPIAVVILDAEARVMEASARWLRDFHLDGRNINGEYIFNLFQNFPEEWTDVYEACLHGESVSVERQYFRRSNGEEMYLNWTARPWYNELEEIKGIILFTENVTEATLAMQKVEAARDIYRKMAQNIPDGGVLVFDTQLRYLLAEGSVLEAAGYVPSEIVGRKLFEVLPPDGVKNLLPLYQQTLAGQSQALEFVADDKRTYLLRTLPLWQDRVVYAGMFVMQDITDLKATSASLALKVMELEQFSRAAWHDLREPMRSIISFSQLLQKKHAAQMDHEASEFLGHIISNARRMFLSINGLAQYIALSDTQIKSVDLGKVAQMSSRPYTLPHHSQGGHIHIGPMPILQADERQMHYLFGQLIENGILHNDKPEKHIRLSATEEDGYHILRFEDNGKGIEHQYLEQIFGFFKQLDSTHKFQKAGIGLSIAHKIALNHQGKIWVESTPGLGSTFFVALPK